jgi:UDP-GlcNAc:undecaprenyl-phosphate GlcNAc-1-phosphate transferase
MLISLVISLVTGAAAMPLVLTWLRRSELMDIPNERSMHVVPVPRGGGVTVLLAAVAGLASVAFPGATFDPAVAVVVPVVAAILGGVGMLDDREGLSAPVRLAGQVVGGIVVVGVVSTDSTLSRMAVACFIVVGAMWVAAYVNGFNFMDGINGISSMQAIATAGALVLIGRRWDVDALTILGGALVGASLAFLPFNFPRARVYLGDVGSYFIGAWLAGAALVGVARGVPIDVMVGPYAIYLADTGLTILKRVRSREKLMTAHRSHAYQRLALALGSHGKSAGIVTACSVVCSAAVLWGSNHGRAGRITGVIVGLAVVGAYLVAPAVLASRGESAAQ